MGVANSRINADVQRLLTGQLKPGYAHAHTGQLLRHGASRSNPVVNDHVT